jgi:hypothetical protein
MRENPTHNAKTKNIKDQGLYGLGKNKDNSMKKPKAPKV